MNKKKKILIAYDGSHYADTAWDGLRRAGLSHEVEAVVLSVAELWLPPISSFDIALGTEPATLAERNEEALALAKRAAECVQMDFPTWSVQAEARIGSPASEIIKKADDWESDLVFIGSHGRSGIERLVLGSVSQKVVHDAPCSVRVVRVTDREKDAPARIVIGFDGSDDAHAAVRGVASRSWPLKTQVRIVTAIGPFYPVRTDGAKMQRSRTRDMQQAVENLLGKAGLSVSSIIEEKDPRQVIIQEAENWKADSIFVGTSGHGRLGRLVLGSVSSAVAARAGCSVEVVREKARSSGS
jgi:nucleotide-binding universal stress UspA family protein